jgi:hypothetical protein
MANNSKSIERNFAIIRATRYKKEVYPSTGGSLIFHTKPNPLNIFSAYLKKI